MQGRELEKLLRLLKRYTYVEALPEMMTDDIFDTRDD